jgi:hypothetical protein
VDHPDVHIAGTQVREKGLKGVGHLLRVPGGPVLILLRIPHGAQVALEDERLPPSGNGLTHLALEVGIGAVHIHAVYPGVQSAAKHGLGKGVVLLQKALAAQGDLTDLQAGAAQNTVLHHAASLLFAVSSIKP